MKNEAILMREVERLSAIIEELGLSTDKKVEPSGIDLLAINHAGVELVSDELVGVEGDRRLTNGNVVGTCPLCHQPHNIEELVYDVETGVVMRRDKAAWLTATEMNLFDAMMKVMPRTVSREKLLNIASSSYEVNEKIIDVYISHIRKKLREMDAKLNVIAVYSNGYRLANEE